MSWNSRQQTLARPVRCSGIGLHTAAEVTLELNPAPVGAGISFRRSDLSGSGPLTGADITADGAMARTTLQKGAAEVQTVEHLMAALVGSGIDNVEVVLDGPEVPGLDGSARPFVELIESAPVETQDAVGEALVVERPVSVHEGDASLLALPYDGGLKITYALHYEDNPLAQGWAEFDVDPDVFRHELAPARTFCMKSEVAALQALGLGKGSTQETTLIIEGDQILGNTLRFSDEPLRHKILDMIGDLALLGAPLRGHLVGVRSGHALNRRLADALGSAARRAPRGTDTDGVGEIRQLVPHRKPFLFIDRILEMERGKHVVALKTVRESEPYFRGHFPGNPLMPGVLIAEAMLQAAAAMTSADFTDQNISFALAQIQKFRIRRAVRPGDELKLEVDLVQIRGSLARLQGRASVNGEIVAEGSFLCAGTSPDSEIE